MSDIQCVYVKVFSLMARSSTTDGSLDVLRKDDLQSESAETRKYDNKYWGSPIDVIEWDSIGSLLAPPLLSGMGIPSPSQENTGTIFDEVRITESSLLLFL